MTGGGYIPDDVRRQSETLRLDTPPPRDQSPVIAGQDHGLGHVAVEEAGNTESSNKKKFSFIRNGLRYHISTTLKTGLETFHKFTEEEWDTIADHVDQLVAQMENGDRLKEVSVNLSTESAIGKGTSENGKGFFSALANFLESAPLIGLVQYVNPLLPQPVTTMPTCAYTSLDSERKAFSSTSSSVKEKEFDRSPSRFRDQEASQIIQAAHILGTHGLTPQALPQVVNSLARKQEAKIVALEACYTQGDKDVFEKLTDDIAKAKKRLHHPENRRGTLEDIKSATAHIQKLESQKAALRQKKTLRTALALHHAPDAHSTRYPHEAHDRTPKAALEHCLQNAFDARFVLCEREGLIGSGGLIDLDTEEKTKKYQEITDTAALLIPHDADDSTKTDALINQFYAGGSSLNALASRPVKETETSRAYPVFKGSQPPQRGEQIRMHETMREIVQRIVYDGTSDITSQVVNALRQEAFKGDQGDAL